MALTAGSRHCITELKAGDLQCPQQEMAIPPLFNERSCDRSQRDQEPIKVKAAVSVYIRRILKAFLYL